MQQFVRNSDGKIRFSPKDTEWLSLFAAEADSVVVILGGTQSQMQNDRQYINEGTLPETPDSKATTAVTPQAVTPK